MTCREFVEQHLGDLLSGELLDLVRRQAEAHLLECADCRNYRVSYEITVRLVRVAHEHSAVQEAAPSAPPNA
jgi:anti-sigma factor RsiW